MFAYLSREPRKGCSNSRGTILRLQIRCGHFPLNKYLHRINKSETDRCQQCADAEGPVVETPAESFTGNHFLFDCPAHTIAREELILVDAIGQENFHLAEIMRR